MLRLQNIGDTLCISLTNEPEFCYLCVKCTNFRLDFIVLLYFIRSASSYQAEFSYLCLTRNFEISVSVFYYAIFCAAKQSVSTHLRIRLDDVHTFNQIWLVRWSIPQSKSAKTNGNDCTAFKLSSTFLKISLLRRTIAVAGVWSSTNGIWAESF